MENMNTMIMMYTHMYSWMVNSWSSEQPNMSEPNPEMAAQFEKDEAERKAERANQAERKANRNNQNAQGWGQLVYREISFMIWREEISLLRYLFHESIVVRYVLIFEIVDFLVQYSNLFFQERAGEGRRQDRSRVTQTKVRCKAAEPGFWHSKFLFARQKHVLLSKW